MIAITVRCVACTVVYPVFEVGPNFRVRVEDNGRPVEGLRVKIEGDRRSGITATVTDKNGLALFRGVGSGSYHVSAGHDAGVSDSADLDVRRNGPNNITVPLRWPNTTPVLVRSLKGKIREPDYLPGQLQPTFSVDLMEGISGRKLKSLRTTPSGEFDFESVTPGRYSLSLPSVLVAVVVDDRAPTDHLDLDLGWTSCGMWYANQSACPQSDLQIRQLAGQVVDVTGAAISNAAILLFDPAENLVERLQSDIAGKFASPRTFAGTYELLVRSSGFTPLHRPVHAEPTGSLSPLTVELGVAGSCSVTRSEPAR